MIVAKTTHAAATSTKNSISTSFGSLTLDATGTLILTNAKGAIISKTSLNITHTTFPLSNAAKGGDLRALSLSFGHTADAKLYGAGAGHSVGFSLEKNASYAHVDNTELMTSRFWSTDGYAALGVSPIPSVDPLGGSNSYGAAYKTSANGVDYIIQGGDRGHLLDARCRRLC
jgi:hypothetical protein